MSTRVLVVLSALLVSHAAVFAVGILTGFPPSVPPRAAELTTSRPTTLLSIEAPSDLLGAVEDSLREFEARANREVLIRKDANEVWVSATDRVAPVGLLIEVASGGSAPHDFVIPFESATLRLADANASRPVTPSVFVTPLDEGARLHFRGTHCRFFGPGIVDSPGVSTAIPAGVPLTFRVEGCAEGELTLRWEPWWRLRAISLPTG